jgi:hypothetical protein
MTHDELLDAIDRQIITAPPFALGGYTRFLQALRAVVELHKPWSMETGPEGDSETETVIGCSCIPELPAFLNPYPCATIQAIEKELG